MNRTIATFLLACASLLCNAQESGATRLQCEGIYNSYTPTRVRDAALKGVFVDVSGDRVKVFGAGGFDATYSIITRREDGLGFQLESDSSYGGFLNRYSGQLSLMQKGETAKDGSFKLKQLVNAVCMKAKSLF